MDRSPDDVAALLTTDVAHAARLLRAGGLVAIPTETVYGLAADAQDVAAVSRVFSVKGRPSDHPLIVHVPGADHLDDWARSVPGYARLLAQTLWPGPLTLVLARTARAGDHVTGGQDTVALRAPAHPVAQHLLAVFGGALAAPSANRFGQVSPTTAGHVLAELGALLTAGRDGVLDGGPCRVGVESTILDCTGPAPLVLRPGGVDQDAVALIGGVPVVQRVSTVRAPGTLASHYAPRARVLLAGDGQEADRLLAPTSTGSGAGATRPADGLLAPYPVTTPPGVVRLGAPRTDVEYARGLYAALREADALGLTRVVAVPPSGAGLAAAVRDRLRRAAAP